MINIFLKELYKITIDSVKDSRESTKFIFDKSDDIIKWIVGFFATIIAFLISEIKMKNIESLKNSDLEYIILIYSFIIIILGLLFRMFSFLTQITLNNITESYLGQARGAIVDTNNIPEPREITENETVENLIYYLKVDFGKDVEYNNDEEYRILLTNYYKTLSEGNDIKQQFETFNQTISKYFGITSKKIKKMSEEVYIIKRGEKYIKYYNISLFLFMATFFVIIILAIKLICIIS